MSLCTLEEICEGCTFAVFKERPELSPVFWECKEKKENETDSILGTCPSRVYLPTTNKELNK
jgi:hypothetical protein